MSHDLRSFGPGIIGVVHANGNGFYPPSATLAKSFLKEDYAPKPLEFPCKMCILAYHRERAECCKQLVPLVWRSQWEYLRDTSKATRYGVVCPADMLNEEGQKLPEGYILSYTELSEVKCVGGDRARAPACKCDYEAMCQELRVVLEGLGYDTYACADCCRVAHAESGWRECVACGEKLCERCVKRIGGDGGNAKCDVCEQAAI